MLTDESASDEFCSIIQFVLQHRIYTRDGSIIRLRQIIRLWNKLGQCEYSWQISYYITVKKSTGLFFCLFIVSAQVFQCSYDIFMQTRTCSYKPRNMLQPMPGTEKMLQNLNLISCKSQYLIFPTMCVFHVLGIQLWQRTTMARVSLSAGSNFTDLR